MRRCLPLDRTFSIDQLLGLLRKAEPDRDFNALSARAQFHLLEKNGEVYRVSRSEERCFLWAVEDFVAPEPSFNSKYLHEAMASLIDELGPLSSLYIALTLQHRGYRAADDPRRFHKCCREVLGDRPDLFRKDDKGRWGLC